MRFGLPVVLLVIVLDQLSKWRMERLLADAPMEVTSFFALVLAWNRGVSFSMLSRVPGPWVAWMLTALAIVVAVVLLAWMSRATSNLMAVALGLIAGGALGNAIDRVRFGAVADFLFFHYAGWSFPAFNLADSAITTGAGLLLLESLFKRPASSYKGSS